MKKLTNSEREGLIYSISEYGDLSYVINWDEIKVKLKIESPELVNAIENKLRADKQLNEALERFAND
ncbi:hypothetical protein [Aliivibrio fischeri]|uniref:hypothetical protein n=1 Tax=Aliivibrio fischeri TaxID=668 RepID=UPI0007C47CDC|nr:hypothetical protein [Aliivibrio fischeri]